MGRLLFRAVCIFALLSGQHSALTHAISHAAGLPAPMNAPAAAQRGDHSDAPVRSNLCALDYLLASLFGVAHASAAAVVPAGGFGEKLSQPLVSRAGVEPVLYLSRGPPSFL
jgi:hypothetical protein